MTPTPMIPRRTANGLVADCPTCGAVCAYWDEYDLDEDGRLICYHD